MEIFHTRSLSEARAASGERYHEFLRKARPPTPRTRVSGRATIRVGTEHEAVTAGSVVYVERGMGHEFHSIEEELEVLVFFAPPEPPDESS